MRQLAAFVLAGAVVAAALYLGLEIALGSTAGEAKPDFSLQSVIVFGLVIAILMGVLLGIGAELRSLFGRHRRA